MEMQKIMKSVAHVDQSDLHEHIRKSVLRAQRCQRNWDFSKTMTQEQVELMVHAATQCPTKQNNQYYSVVVTQDRDKIEAIHDTTLFKIQYGPSSGYQRTNPQVLAHTLIAFTRHDFTTWKNEEQNKAAEGKASEKELRIIEDDRIQAVGVAAGFVNMAAAMIGLQTGCCKCFDRDIVRNILEIDEEPMLLMGVGYGDVDRRRREHHITGEYIGSYSKKIDVHYR